MIAHIVLFNPKPELSKRDVWSFTKSVGDAFRSIDEISRVNVGRRIVIDTGYPRSFGDKTYEFAAILEFRDETALLDYLRHPRHHELGRLFWEMCDSTIVSEQVMTDGRGDNLAEFLEG
jgi:hypothetical protein